MKKLLLLVSVLFCGFIFGPTSQVDASTVYLRGTGGISLELTQT